MNDSQPDIDQEMKKAQLATAQIELQLRQQELRDRPTFWKNALTNPIVLGAIITAFIALNTGIFNSMAFVAQYGLERFRTVSQVANDERKFEAELILNAIRTGDPRQSMTNIEFLIQAGLIRDSEGKLMKFMSQRQRSLPQLPGSPTAPN